MYLGIILLGMFNGLAALPVALYWLGSRTNDTTNQSLISKENSSIYLPKS